ANRRPRIVSAESEKAWRFSVISRYGEFIHSLDSSRQLKEMGNASDARWISSRISGQRNESIAEKTSNECAASDSRQNL
ncbi:MAG: hypothetical protein ACXWML_07275, partial [Candidatus Binataceae bacterium]